MELLGLDDPGRCMASRLHEENFHLQSDRVKVTNCPSLSSTILALALEVPHPQEWKQPRCPWIRE